MTTNLYQDIDKEWEKFVCSNYTNLSSDDEYDSQDENEENELNYFEKENNLKENNVLDNVNSDESPKPTDIYISTKTKIAYLNMYIDLNIFWDIPVIPYAKPLNGVIKKQIKINSLNIDDLELIQEKLKKEQYYDEHIITNINNPNGRIKFKDIRKISIGLCKKDIMSYRCKKKSVFYNCFVLILRLKVKEIFKEFHVKVFNTGKLEIPGIQNDDTFNMILEFVQNILHPHVNSNLAYKDESCETVLINSNFNCGYFINREIFYDILKMKYDIQAIYDPCSYPGIQCKFYYNPDLGIQTGSQISEQNKHLYKNIKKVSFMIFRTGSILIVGKCDENVLRIIYKFLVDILCAEYKNIGQKMVASNMENDKTAYLKDKKKKIRKKNIMVHEA